MIVYYSPFGGAVRACILRSGENAPQPDPQLELEVLQGTLRRLDEAEAHELAEHIRDRTTPTVLSGWIVTGERLQYRGS